MSRLSRGQVFEIGFWLIFAAIAYTASFDFDKEIEIYRYGAASWPRVIIVLIVIAALCQLFQDFRTRASDSQGTAAGVAQGQRSLGERFRVALVLGLPVIYASLLDTTGFYATTPVFIFAYLVLNGERRIGWLVGITVAIYTFLIVMFTKLLYVGLPIGYAKPFYDFSNWFLVWIQ